VSCPSSVTRSMYADAALPADQSAAVEAHLADCAACRAKVARLRAERDDLRAALRLAHDVDAIPAFVPPSRTPELLALALGMLAVATVAGVFWSAVGRAIPSWLQWLNPLDPGALADRAIDLIALLITEGNTMLTSAVNFSAAALAVALLTWGALSLGRPRAGAAMLVSLLVFVLALPGPGHALEIRRTQGITTISAGETIDDTVIALGKTVTVDGNVNGDLLAFGETVTVRGNVAGDLITGAETVTVEGTVGGSIIGGGRGVSLRGARVTRNFFAGGRDIDIGANASVNGNAMTFGNEIHVDGLVGIDLKSFGADVAVGGNVQRDVEAFARDVTLLPSARIGRNLTVHLDNADNLEIASGATVGGTINRQLVDREQRRNRYLTVGFYVRQVVRLGAAFLTGLALLWMFPALRTLPLLDAPGALRAGGIGLVAAVTAPVAALLACITVVGLPIGIVTFVLGAIALYFSKAVVAQLIGRAMFHGPAGEPHYAATLLAGFVVVLIAINVPYIGGIVNAVLTLVGLGLIVDQLLGGFRHQRAA
jgi:predicted anti-sigma-YlaC factor YlaD